MIFSDSQLEDLKDSKLRANRQYGYRFYKLSFNFICLSGTLPVERK